MSSIFRFVPHWSSGTSGSLGMKYFWAWAFFSLEMFFFVATVWSFTIQKNVQEAGFCIGMGIWFKLERMNAQRAATPGQHETEKTS